MTDPLATFELHTPEWAKIADCDPDPLETPTRLAIEWEENAYVERVPGGEWPIIGYGKMEQLA